MFVGRQDEEKAAFHLLLLFQCYILGSFSKLDLKTVKFKSKDMLRTNTFFILTF